MVVGIQQIVLIISDVVVSACKDIPVTSRFRRDGLASFPVPEAEPPDGAIGAG
jgi:hypothetical protein